MDMPEVEGMDMVEE
jgi:hypothetical protein